MNVVVGREGYVRTGSSGWGDVATGDIWSHQKLEKAGRIFP